jgi:hypothetical protein
MVPTIQTIVIGSGSGLQGRTRVGAATDERQTRVLLSMKVDLAPPMLMDSLMANSTDGTIIPIDSDADWIRQVR